MGAQMAGRDEMKLMRKGAAPRSRTAPTRAAQATAVPTGGVPQYALALQAGAGNRATARALARVTYPHLRAVDPTAPDR
jgi:hypothetical protein